MIESVENSIGLAVLIICTVIALTQAIRTRERSWTLLALAIGSSTLAGLFWLVCLVFYGRTPQVATVSDLSWYALYLFMYMLLREVAPPKEKQEKRLLPWVGPVVTAGLTAYYMQYGKIVSNVIYWLLVSLLLFSSTRKLMDRQHYAKQRALSAVILAFCVLEYALWTSSCFGELNTLLHPYFWFDFLLVLCYPFIIWGTKRAVAP